jgi:hypothetical protein
MLIPQEGLMETLMEPNHNAIGFNGRDFDSGQSPEYLLYYFLDYVICIPQLGLPVIELHLLLWNE